MDRSNSHSCTHTLKHAHKLIHSFKLPYTSDAFILFLLPFVNFLHISVCARVCVCENTHYTCHIQWFHCSSLQSFISTCTIASHVACTTYMYTLYRVHLDDGEWWNRAHLLHLLLSVNEKLKRNPQYIDTHLVCVCVCGTLLSISILDRCMHIKHNHKIVRL